MTKRKVVQSDLIDLLLADYRKPEDLIGENGILKQLTKAIVERALQDELAIHLGHDKHEAVANEHGNTRNGSSAKTLKGDFGALPIDIPRDRDGSFDPQLIAKHQTRWSGFDDNILSLYARGITVREIQSHREEMYGAEVSPGSRTGACSTSSLLAWTVSKAFLMRLKQCSRRRQSRCASCTWCATA